MDAVIISSLEPFWLPNNILGKISCVSWELLLKQRAGCVTKHGSRVSFLTKSLYQRLQSIKHKQILGLRGLCGLLVIAVPLTFRNKRLFSNRFILFPPQAILTGFIFLFRKRESSFPPVQLFQIKDTTCTMPCLIGKIPARLR